MKMVSSDRNSSFFMEKRVVVVRSEKVEVSAYVVIMIMHMRARFNIFFIYQRI